MEILQRRYKTFVFIAIQMILYLWFLFLDFSGTGINLSAYIKYTMIILCFCYVLFYNKEANKSIVFYLRAALFFTVTADLFLLILDYYLLGVLVFIITQQFYGRKLDYEVRLIKHEGEAKEDYKHWRGFYIRVSLQLLATIVILATMNWFDIAIDPLLLATVFYFVSIITNVMRSIVIARRKRGNIKGYLFAIGMLLFLLCDINVGFYNLSYYITLPSGINEIMYFASQILMWTFYAPSQVLIALSIRQN